MATTICRHIRINGDRCNALSLRNDVFCYYHAKTGERHRNMVPANHPTTTIPKFSPDGRELNEFEVQYYTPVDGPLQLDFPPLEDRESIQVALSMLITAMARDRIDLKRATQILYGLQVASANAKGLTLQTHRETTVTEPVHDEDTGVDLAPDEEPESVLISQQLVQGIEDEEMDEQLEELIEKYDIYGHDDTDAMSRPEKIALLLRLLRQKAEEDVNSRYDMARILEIEHEVRNRPPVTGLQASAAQASSSA